MSSVHVGILEGICFLSHLGCRSGRRMRPSGGLQVPRSGPGGGPRVGCWMGMRMSVSGNATECCSINLFFLSIVNCLPILVLKISGTSQFGRNNGWFPNHFTEPQAESQEGQREGSSTGQQPGQRLDHGRSIDRLDRYCRVSLDIEMMIEMMVEGVDQDTS